MSTHALISRRLATVACLATICVSTNAIAQGRRFEVSVSPEAHAGPLTGRLVLAISKIDKGEPRMSISPTGPEILGVDLDQLPAGQTVTVTDSAIGFPMQLSELPEGDYSIQAVVNVYEQLHRSDGHTIWAHMNDGSIEFFFFAAGNLYSDVQHLHIGRDGAFRLTINHVIPKPKGPQDTEWMKHVQIQSQILTKFWGRPVFINATVLLPKGYAEHPNTYYPSVYPLGHGDNPFGFTTRPAHNTEGGEINPIELRRGARVDKNSGLESGYDFYKSWTSDPFPRVIAITLAQATPYFPDSYSVNSVNNGPYGDAIVQEVVPYLEKHFRIIPKPYARQLEGASTSGWQTLALQLQHPDFFGGAWVLQPDPIDFRHYQQTNLYTDDNAFSIATGQFTAEERPFRRTVTGQVTGTIRELSRFEDVLGSRGRSGYQLEAWEAVFGPIDADGYPVPLWDKRTGKIDHKVADYMRDHGFDLHAYAEKNWTTLGPKLQGKLHFFAGDMDNFYLNLAVYDWENFLKATTNPHSNADFTYGRPERGHGSHSYTWAEMVHKMAAAIKAEAPRGEDIKAWNY
jgi:hypothetical protein